MNIFRIFQFFAIHEHNFLIQALIIMYGYFCSIIVEFKLKNTTYKLNILFNNTMCLLLFK